MDFDEIEKNKVVEDVMKTRALEAEMTAYQASLNVKHTEALLAAEVPGAQERLEVVKDKLTTDSRRAKRASGASGVNITKSELEKRHREFLRQWKRSLQAEYAAHEAQANERRRVLALTGDLAPTDEEKLRIEENLSNNVQSMQIIELAHEVATNELSSMAPEEESSSEVSALNPSRLPM